VMNASGAGSVQACSAGDRTEPSNRTDSRTAMTYLLVVCSLPGVSPHGQNSVWAERPPSHGPVVRRSVRPDAVAQAQHEGLTLLTSDARIALYGVATLPAS
jgi:hypothetical protein